MLSVVKMKISELNVGQGNVDVEGVLKEIGEKRSFNKFGRELVVANAVLEDDSGFIKLSLWNEDVERFEEGDRVRIVNGYVNEFQGEKQLTSGKYGKIEKIGEGEAKPEEPEKKPDEPPAKEDEVDELAEDLSEGTGEED